jgi:DNA-directed RNA polymerase specialized sigma24 family protein
VAALPGDLRRLILRLREGDDDAWAEFVSQFAPLLSQAAASVERDRDAAADAFVFTCERLRERNCARLAAFDFDRPGTFESWLRVVAINLTRDARRQRLGRLRPLAIARRFPPLEQDVFRLRYEVGLTFDQILNSLAPKFPGLTESRLAEADALVAASVSSRQRWTLLTRRPRVDSLTAEGMSETDAAEDIPDNSPDPEWLAIAGQSREVLNLALSKLSVEDRLLLRLSVERGLALSTLARMFALSNPQAAHRRLQAIFKQMRQMLEGAL